MAQWADGIHVGIHDTKTVSHRGVRYRFLMLEPMVGLEPTTCCLRNSCSTTELHRHTYIF